MLFIFSMPALLRHLWRLKTVVFLHWCLIRAFRFGKHAAGRVYNNNCINFPQNLLYNVLTRLTYSIILYKSSQTFVDYKLYVCGKKTINEINQKVRAGNTD